jgi:aspartyl-tRNA(Asn)/glutamyl-tRNA(Gln) amidotransferase subunit C
MMTPELIKNLAALAQLDMTDQFTIENTQQALQNIFLLIDELNNVDVSNVEPLVFPLDILGNHFQPMRDDIAVNVDIQNAQLHIPSNAPLHEQGFYLVPKVID